MAVAVATSGGPQPIKPGPTDFSWIPARSHTVTHCAPCTLHNAHFKLDTEHCTIHTAVQDILALYFVPSCRNQFTVQHINDTDL